MRGYSTGVCNEKRGSENVYNVAPLNQSLVQVSKFSGVKTFLKSVLGQVCLHVKDQTISVYQHGDLIVHLFQISRFSFSAVPRCQI